MKSIRKIFHTSPEGTREFLGRRFPCGILGIQRNFRVKRRLAVFLDDFVAEMEKFV